MPLVCAGIKDLVTSSKTCEDDSLYNFVQRRFGKEVARILKPQGSALFGWLNADMVFGFQPKSVWDCVGEIDGVNMSIYDDIDLWGSPELSNKNSYSVILKINRK